MTGTHERPLLDLEATGRAIDLRLLHAFDLEGGRIAAYRPIPIGPGLLEQLGVEEPPPSLARAREILEGEDPSSRATLEDYLERLRRWREEQR